MTFRRSLLAAAVPLAAGLPLVSSAAAASSTPPVTVRVEGATRTLLPARTVTAPASGSITKGGTPAGTCPADSAAGALAAAVHGHWNGTYYKGLGIDVSTILGTTLSFSKGSYWGFFVDGRLASKGICDTHLTRGESLLFAPLPAKGTAPKPILLSAPRTVRMGRVFTVRAFVDAAKGSATAPVRGARAHWSLAGLSSTGGRPRVTELHGSRAGVLRFRISHMSRGRATLVVSAPGAIRSAAQTIAVRS